MKLEELRMYPAPISDTIFLGTIKKDKRSGFNIWKNRIDFTNQFFECLAELCKKELNKTNEDNIRLVEEFQSGLKIEINAYIDKG